MISSDDGIPTETFLLPGQQFCVGLPWERAALPKHGLPPPPPPKPPLSGSTLDQDAAQDGDPCAGLEVGPCEVLRRLTVGSARRLLAVRTDGVEAPALVELRRIEGPDSLAQEVASLAARAAQVRHPGLLRVYPSEVSDEGIFWVTEHLAGVTVAELTQACRASGKRIPFGFALGLFYDAALALAELHAAGLHHGLLGDHGVGVTFEGAAKLREVGLFGCLARRESWAEVSEAMAAYLAPEQVLRGQLPDAKSDVFSLATVLYECLAERKARAGQADAFVPLSRFDVALGALVDEVLRAALERDRSRRTASAVELARALKTASTGMMWKAEQRAQFIAPLFANRLRRDAVLESGLASQELPEVVVGEELPAAAAAVAPVVPVVFRPAAPRPPVRLSAPPVPRGAARNAVRLAGLAVATLVACLAWWTAAAAVPLEGDLIIPSPWQLARPAVAAALGLPAEVEPPSPPLRPVLRAPAAAAAVAAPAAPAQVEEPASAEAAPPKAVRAAPKRQRPARDDSPLPPWLARGKRGRR